MKRVREMMVCLLLLVVAGGCMAQSNQTSYKVWFDEGNTAYNEGRYEEALSAYNQIVASGVESAPLYYNIGNSYYKTKDYSHAILYYEKALKLDPSNEDIKTNLGIANLAVVDKIEQLPQSFIARWWDGLKSIFTVDQWAWVSVGSFALLLCSLFAFLMSRRMGWRKTGFFTGLVFVLVFGLSLFFAISKYHDTTVQDDAIVMTPTVTVKSSPNVSSVDLFVLHEGAKVKILDTADEWNKIRIANGSVGWIQVKDVTAF